MAIAGFSWTDMINRNAIEMSPSWDPEPISLSSQSFDDETLLDHLPGIYRISFQMDYNALMNSDLYPDRRKECVAFYARVSRTLLVANNCILRSQEPQRGETISFELSNFVALSRKIDPELPTFEQLRQKFVGQPGELIAYCQKLNQLFQNGLPLGPFKQEIKRKSSISIVP